MAGREAEAASGQVAPLSRLSSEPPRGGKRGGAGGREGAGKGGGGGCGCGSRREVGLSGRESVKKQRRDSSHTSAKPGSSASADLRSLPPFSSPSRNFSTSRLSRPPASATSFTRRLLVRCLLPLPERDPLSGRKGSLARPPTTTRSLEARGIARPRSPPGLCAKSLGEAPLPALGTPPPRPDYL